MGRQYINTRPAIRKALFTHLNKLRNINVSISQEKQAGK
jgi:hypothetical protein